MKMLWLISTLAATLFPAANLWAIPAGFNIQGRLTNSSGINETGTFAIKFTIYPSTSPNTPVWEETKPGVTVTNGNFQVVLQGEQLETAVKDLTGAEVEITVNNEAPLRPRQQLLRSPFSADFVGAVMWFYRISCPKGYLHANGAQVAESDFPELAAAMGKTGLFNLPDLRGEFIRGLDSGRGVDSNRTLGSPQAQQIEQHFHSSGFDLSQFAYGASGLERLNGRATGNMGTRNTNLNGQPGDETRPRNIALLPCIKY